MTALEIKPTRAQRIRVYAVVWLAAAILLYLIYLLAGGGRDLFEQRTTLTSYMPDATGLLSGTDGSEVRLSGIRIGHVSSIEVSDRLDPQHAVKIEMLVRTRYLRNIPRDSQTGISSDTLVGYQFVDIAEGKSPVPIGENGVLESQPAKDQLIRADLVKTLQDNVAAVDQLLANISSGENPIGQFILGEDMYDKVMTEVQGFDQAVRTFIMPQSQLGQAFYSLEAYNDISNLIQKVDQSLSSIQNGQGMAGRLFASDDQYNTLVQQLTDLHSQLTDINAGKGPLGTMILDDTAYNNIQRMLKSTDELLTSLNAGDGQFGHLLNNAQLYESLNGSLKGMEDFLREFRGNPKKYLRVQLRHK